MAEEKDFKIVFMGTPDFAVASLDAILKKGFDVVGVVTAPDRPAGRGQKIRQSAVKGFALEHGLNILQPENLKDQSFHTELEALEADLFAVVAFRMLPEAVWTMPKKGTINLHGSLLPQYRGAAPINWAIINGEKETGVTTFFIDKKIDTGDIIQQRTIPISENMTAGELHDNMMNIGAELLVETIGNIQADTIQREKQSINKEYKPAPKIFRKDCRLDLNRSIQDVHNHIRGLSPYPAAWIQLQNSNGQKKSFKIYKSEIAIANNTEFTHPALINKDSELFLSLKDGLLKIDHVQLEGKKRMKAEAFLSGFNTADWRITED
tara:strand:+ start:126011 stop:126976 length:966 start_codon:yes stop_codon:yes gene_type:complete